MRRWTRELIAIDSVTGREAQLALWLERELPARGWTVELDQVSPGRLNLLARFDAAPPSLLFNTHLDTVPEAYGPDEDSVRLYGRGACDTKGILAAMLEALEDARNAGRQGLGLLLVVGEERDHSGAIHAGRTLPTPATLVVGEPTENVFLKSQKGLLSAQLCAAGIEGHSGYPENFDSAVDKLLPVLERLRRASWLAQHSAAGTTVNFAMLEGGNAFNKVAGAASAHMLFRLAEPAVEVIRRTEESLGLLPDGVHLEWYRAESSDPVDGIDVLPDHPCGVAAFGTDLPYFDWSPQRKFLVGPGSIQQAHRDVVGGDRQRGEWIDKNAQEDGARLYRELIERCCR